MWPFGGNLFGLSSELFPIRGWRYPARGTRGRFVGGSPAESPRGPSLIPVRAASASEWMRAPARSEQAPGRDQWLPGRGSSGTARRARGVVLAPAACRASTRLAARGGECKGAWRGPPRLRHMVCSPGPQQLQPGGSGREGGTTGAWTRRAQASGAGVDSALGARGCARRNTAAWAPPSYRGTTRHGGWGICWHAAGGEAGAGARAGACKRALGFD